MEIAKSINDVPIRLTNERWIHIIENHDDLAGYYDETLLLIENPDYVINGYEGALIAFRSGVTSITIGIEVLFAALLSVTVSVTLYIPTFM